MKNEKIKEFLTDLAQEKSFKYEFLKFKENVEKKGFSKNDNEKLISEHLLPWSKKLGYELTKKDFIDFDRTQKPTEITGLTAEQLENVSGGGFAMLLALFATFGSALASFAGGGGTTGNNTKTNDNFGSTDLTSFYSSGATSSSEGGVLSQPEVTLNMLKEGHKIGNVILDEYKQPEIDSIDYYNSNYGKSIASFNSDADGGGGAQQIQSTPVKEKSIYFSVSKQSLRGKIDRLCQSLLYVDEGLTADALSLADELVDKLEKAESIDALNEIESELPALKNLIDVAIATTTSSANSSPVELLGSASSSLTSVPNGSEQTQTTSEYGKNIGDSPSTSGGALDTINMLKDVRAAESDNSKAVETQVERGGGSGQVSIYTGLDSSGHAFSAAPAAGESMSTALVTMPDQPQTSVTDYNENFARSSVTEALRPATSSSDAHQAQPTPAGDAFSPVNLSTWKELPAQSGSAGEEYAQNDAKAQKGTTGIASVDNYLVGEGEILSDGGQTPVDFENPKNASVEQVQTESEVFDDLNPFALNQNMFSHSSTPTVTPLESGDREPAPGLLSSIGRALISGANKLGDAFHNYADNYMNNYGETSVEEHDRPYGETSAEDYDQNYARTSHSEFERHHGETSTGDYDQNYGRTSRAEFERHHGTTSADDYDQNYARSYRPKSHTFNMGDLSSKNGVHTETLGAPLGVPSEVSDALDAYPQTGGTSQQTRLAGNVGAGLVDASSPLPLGAPEGFTVAQPSSGTQQTRLDGDVGTGSADASAPISLDVPEGVNVSTTSSALGGQETINMLKDIHAAENANFKAIETQTNQDSADKSISTALVTTPGQPQPSVNDYNKRFARFSAAVDSGENVVQMLKDIHVEANDGSAAGYPLSTAPETTPVQHEILQQTESAGSTIELLGLEGENSTSSGPVSGVTSGGIRWHLNTKGETVFDRATSSAQTTTTTTTGGSNSGPGTTTTSASTPSSTGSPSVGLLGYSQSSAGSGSVGSEQPQTTVATQALNITTGFAGGGTLADAPLYNQTNTRQGNPTFSATQNNTTSNTTSDSFTSGSSQNWQSWKDIVKGTAQMTGIAAGLGAAAIGSVYAAGAAASALSGDGAQQNASKTKETTAKTEEKTSTKGAKKEDSGFMRDFKAGLNPLTIKYLDSLQ